MSLFLFIFFLVIFFFSFNFVVVFCLFVWWGCCSFSFSLTLSDEELKLKKHRDDAHARYCKLRTELHSPKMALQQLDNFTHIGDSGDWQKEQL